jgi:hypothetical protein
VCKTCPEMRPGRYKFMESCAKCGCLLRGKVMIRSATCPLDKWQLYEKPRIMPTEVGPTD